MSRTMVLHVHCKPFQEKRLRFSWKNMLWEQVQYFGGRKKDFLIPWKTRKTSCGYEQDYRFQKIVCWNHRERNSRRFEVLSFRLVFNWRRTLYCWKYNCKLTSRKRLLFVVNRMLHVPDVRCAGELKKLNWPALEIWIITLSGPAAK